MSPFQIIDKGKHGDTVYVENPKLDAMKQAWHTRNVLGVGYRMTVHEDGAYTVEGDGCAAITFEKERAA